MTPLTKKISKFTQATNEHPWRFLTIITAYLCLAMSISACGGGSAGVGNASVPPTTGNPPAGGEAIAVWGDSTTSGVGATAGMSYPDQLASLTGRSVFNGGVSGQTSDQIAARQGGAPARVTFLNNSMPASGTVELVDQSTFPVSAEGPGPITGTINGIHGTLDYQRTNAVLVFTRDTSGSALSIPAQTSFLPDTFGRQAVINVFWMGQNNFYQTAQIKSDIANCINSLTSSRFIVLSILNAETEVVGTAPYNAIIQLNNELAQAYPNNYIDIRQILVDNYNPASSQDVRDYNNNTPPASLRSDNEHLNEAGYRIVAQQVAAFIARKGW